MTWDSLKFGICESGLGGDVVGVTGIRSNVGRVDDSGSILLGLDS